VLIGIAGQIGSGKSEVARIFKKHGAFVLSADKIGREVVEKNPATLKRLVKAFGKKILSKTGRLRRRSLGEIAFASEEEKRKLNNIVHPVLLKELENQARAVSRKYDMVVIDAALLIDWKWDRKVDYTILVHAPDKIKLDRLIKMGYSKAEAGNRIRSQLKYRELRKRSDFVVLNNKSLDSLELKVKKIVMKLRQKC
jgi:dephospho-CoA kinase